MSNFDFVMRSFVLKQNVRQVGRFWPKITVWDRSLGLDTDFLFTVQVWVSVAVSVSVSVGERGYNTAAVNYIYHAKKLVLKLEH